MWLTKALPALRSKTLSINTCSRICMSETAVFCLCHSLAMETVTIETERHPVCLQSQQFSVQTRANFTSSTQRGSKMPTNLLVFTFIRIVGWACVCATAAPHKCPLKPYLAVVARDIVLGRPRMHFGEHTSFNLSLAKQPRRNAKAILKLTSWLFIEIHITLLIIHFAKMY